MERDWEALARAVDERVYRRPSDRDVDARMYGIVVVGDAFDRPKVRLLEKGEGQRLLRKTRLPSGLTAMAMSMGGWRAPLPAEGSAPVQPSRHPQRLRIHTTAVVGGAGVLVTVMRTASATAVDGRVEVMAGGVGRVPDAMRTCWLRAMVRQAGRAEGDALPWAIRP